MSIASGSRFHIAFLADNSQVTGPRTCLVRLHPLSISRGLGRGGQPDILTDRLLCTELNPHFGTKQDLVDLSNALHRRGMYLMVDVVANHVGAVSKATFLPGEMYGPFNSPADYHPYCTPTNWNDQLQVEQCERYTRSTTSITARY